jgi:hypothetical protein
LVVKRFEVLANGNQGSPEALGEIPNQNAAIRAQELQDFPATFLAEHEILLKVKGFVFFPFTLSELVGFHKRAIDAVEFQFW